MNQLYWLSFTDPDRPTGEQFLGVAIVEITPEDITIAGVQVTQRFGERALEAFEIGAALTKSHALGINPGGEVGSVDITEAADRVPPEARHRLLSKQELQQFGLI